MKPKIGIIGAGNMGGAIFRALAAMPKFSENVFLADLDAQKLEKIGAELSQNLNADFSGNFFVDANEMARNCDFLILAIKPQSLEKFAENFRGEFSSKILISILAGTKIAKLRAKLNFQKIARAMPNLPAQISAGVCGVFCAKEISPREQKMICEILESFSKIVECETESDIDKITALSGSGPAYFFYLTALLQNAAIKMGFEKKLAAKIARQTFVGAAEIFKIENFSADEFVAKVASRGGTTEAALNFWRENNFAEIFDGGIAAAKKRATEL